MQGIPDGGHEASHSLFPVLQLAPAVGGNDAKLAVGVQSGREPGQQQGTLVGIETGRLRHVPPQLDPCRGPVYVLATRAPGRGGTELQFGYGQHEPLGDGQFTWNHPVR